MLLNHSSLDTLINWTQGTTTVGNAADLSLSRQVQLATIARIRHTYTDYDKLLKIVSWKEARQIVEPFSLTKLIEWRGENDNDTEGFEEILRETIVIDDDDELEDADSDTDSNTVASGDDGSDTSLEILQQTLAPKDLNVGVGEKARNAVTSVGRAVGRALPAAVQTRWQNARMQQQRAGQAPAPHGHGGHISVPLDQRGKVPRKVVSEGVEYVRVSWSIFLFVTCLNRSYNFKPRFHRARSPRRSHILNAACRVRGLRVAPCLHLAIIKLR